MNKNNDKVKQSRADYKAKARALSNTIAINTVSKWRLPNYLAIAFDNCFNAHVGQPMLTTCAASEYLFHDVPTISPRAPKTRTIKYAMIMNHQFNEIFHCETASGAETQAAGEAFGRTLHAGDLVCLRGDMGAGKTTWTQGVARALGIESAVTSPTFVLINEHKGRETLLHLDAYRLENADEENLRDAGIFDFLERDDAIQIIEWPQRIESFLPKKRIEILIENCGENRRRITRPSFHP